MKVRFLLGAAALALLPAAGLAERIYAVDEVGNLIRFDSATPGVIESSVAIAGLTDFDFVAALDFRPATGQLFAFVPQYQWIDPPPGGFLHRLYVITLATGQATRMSGSLYWAGFGSEAGFDFSPVDDEIRLVEGSLNVRMNPDTAELSADSPLTPRIWAVGLAYDHNVAGATSGTAYALDILNHNLVRIGGIDGVPPPSSGEVSVVGPLGVPFSYFASFDISPSGTAYAVLSPPNHPGVPEPSQLYTVDLATGAATLVGTVGPPPGLRIVAMAVAPEGGGQGVVEIPAVGPWGLFFLTAGLCAAGMSRLRRRRPAAS